MRQTNTKTYANLFVTQERFKYLTISEKKEIKNFYLESCKLHFKEVIEDIKRGAQYKLPSRMGMIKLEKKKTFAIDWSKSKDCNCLAYHNNLNTYGHVYYFKWHKKDTLYLIKHLNLYSFRVSRTIKRELAKQLKENLIWTL